MNRKILNASLIAVSLCSLQCYSQPYTTNVEAMGIDPYALDVTLENYKKMSIINNIGGAYVQYTCC